MSRCLYCYQVLPAGDGPAYHPGCSRKLFGRAVAPAFPYSKAELLSLAEEVVRQHITVTGVQPKLSLRVADVELSEEQLDIVSGGVVGDMIFKP